MDRDRWFNVAEVLSAAAAPTSSSTTMCSKTMELLFVDGVSIAVVTALSLTPMCVTDPVIASFGELQFTAGDGPALEAFGSGHPVLQVNMAKEMGGQWPMLSALDVDPRLGSVFAYPLRVGAARIGVLTVYLVANNDLSQSQHADALLIADVVAHLVLSLRSNTPGETLAVAFTGAWLSRAEIHQASGMLAEQIHVPVADALVHLRSYAYATNRPIAGLAAAVVGRRLRLTRDATGDIGWTDED